MHFIFFSAKDVLRTRMVWGVKNCAVTAPTENSVII